MPAIWHCAFRLTFRLLPRDKQSAHARVLLDSDGMTPDEILARLPYDKARAKAPGEHPDPKRYRDPRQLLRTVGLVYEEEREGRTVLRVTELGKTTRRWMDRLTEQNCPILSRHVALALAACQLQTPTREGKNYTAEVFPFRTIWQVMLALNGRINSDELNRAVFKIGSDEEIARAIEAIRIYRVSGNVGDMGPETVTEEAKNDRILVWMGLASFGWMLIEEKGGDGYYSIRPNCLHILTEASRIRHRHRTFTNEAEYFRHISRCAALPPDLR
jgi:hypothetical protein